MATWSVVYVTIPYNSNHKTKSNSTRLGMQRHKLLVQVGELALL